MKLASFSLLALAAANPAAPHFPPCCAYGGDGGAVALGVGTLNAFPPPRNSPNNFPTGPAYAAPMAVGISPSKLFASILFAAASGPEDAAAGWIVTSNATNDVIYVFANVSAAGPSCAAGVAPRGAMVSTYRFCGGPGGLFSSFASSYMLTPSTRVGVFQSGGSGGSPVTSSMAFADPAACAPTSLVGASSPFGTGAFSVSFQSGVASEPPASWSQPPSWCEGKWADMS